MTEWLWLRWNEPEFLLIQLMLIQRILLEYDLNSIYLYCDVYVIVSILDKDGAI